MDVSIILVNYRTLNLTINCINSIIKNTIDIEYEIIVVDNSCDESAYKLLEKAISNKAILINSNVNLGFGKANNLGSRIAKGKKLLFLNTDTILINNAIKIMFDCFDNNVGVVGSNLLKENGKKNFSYELNEKNIANERKNMSLIHNFFKKFHKNNSYNTSNQIIEINGFVSGACLMVDKSLFNKIGGFEKEIFMYAEDALLCYRIKNELNYKIVNTPDSKVIHYEGGSFKDVSQFRIKTAIEGNVIYYKKLFGKDLMIEYLKLMAKSYHKLEIICALLFMNKRRNKFREFRLAYKKEYEKQI